jgi:hypothetical protein
MTNLFHFIPSAVNSPHQNAQSCVQCLASCVGMNLGSPMPNGYCDSYCANVCGNSSNTRWKSSANASTLCDRYTNPFCDVSRADWPNSGTSTAWPRSSFNNVRGYYAPRVNDVHQFGSFGPCDMCKFECSLCTKAPCPTPVDVEKCVQTKCPSCN